MLVFVRTLRCYQWSKNLLVFGALIFAQQLHIPGQVLRSILVFFAFCMLSSAMYIFNDLIDIENDRIHPEKKTRPLASGEISQRVAGAIMILCLFLGLGCAWWLGVKVLLITLLYVGLIGAYTLFLKNAIVVDVIVVSIGFVIRAVAGAMALEVVFSNWLVVCTMFFALFLSISKRRHEISILEHRALDHREVLGHYSAAYLDAINQLVAGATLITYTIYTCSPEVVDRVKTDKLYLTLPFIVYGLFRYLYLVHNDLDGGDPSRTLLRDRPLSVTVLLWGIACVAILYARSLL